MNFLKNFFYSFIVYATDDLKPDPSLQPILDIVIGVASALALLSTAVCILRYMTADDGNTIANAKNDIKNIWIAYIALTSVGLIVKFALSIVTTGI